MDVALPISTVAQRLGISQATLRAWQRRYGLGASGVSSGGHRRYTSQDIARLHAAQQLIEGGVAPREAAQAALALPSEELPAVTIGNSIHPAETAHPAAISSPVRVDAGATPPAEPGCVALRRKATARNLRRAAYNLDGPTIAVLLRAFLTEHGVRSTWEELLRPVLRSVGNRWCKVPDGIAAEQLVSQIALTVLGEVASRAPASARQPIVLACAPDEQHSLPLSALAAALAEDGVRVHNFAGRTPAHTLAAVVTRIRPIAVVVLALTEETADPTVFDPLRDGTSYFAAGPGWRPDRLPTSVRHLNSLRRALTVLCPLVPEPAGNA